MAHILIVEDDRSAAEGIRALVATRSHQTVVTRSGQEGIELLSVRRFDLVITDLMLEQGTGLDVLEWARSNARDLPFLVCSSYTRPESLRLHLEGLKHRMIRKPFEAGELLVLIDELLIEAAGRD